MTERFAFQARTASGGTTICRGFGESGFPFKLKGCLHYLAPGSPAVKWEIGESGFDLLRPSDAGSTLHGRLYRLGSEPIDARNDVGAMTSTGGANNANRSGEHPEPAADASVSGAVMRLEQLVQNVAVIAAILYVVGLLTTNAYLYSLGVADFSLLRARFVLTGLVTLMPLAIALIGGLYAADELAALGGAASGAARVARWILRDVAVPCALFFLLFWFLFWYAAGNEPLAAARTAALLGVACAVVVVVLLGGLAIYQVTGRGPVSHLLPRGRSRVFGQLTGWMGIPDPVLETLALAVAGPVLILTYIGWFGHHVYPAIPEQLGGGQPRVVQLLIAAEAIPAAGELGLQVAQNTPATPPVELLWAGDDIYVVRLPSPREPSIVQLASDLVDGMVTGPPFVPATTPRP